MLIRIPNNLSNIFSQRVFLVLCIFLALAFLVKTTTDLIFPKENTEQPTVPAVVVSGAELAQLYATQQKFLCVDNHLYAVLDNKIYALLDSSGEQIVCKTA